MAGPGTADVPAGEVTRAIDLGRPVPLRSILAPLAHGAGDPAVRFAADGVWRASTTPDGPGLMLLRAGDPDAGNAYGVEVRAWGPGAQWLADTAADLIGAADDLTGFEPGHPVVARSAHAHPHWRIGRTGQVWETLAATVLEQKVTGREARDAWRELLTRAGAVPPGPAPAGMRVPPTPQQWAALPDATLHRAGVGPQRMRTLRRAATVADSLQRIADAEPARLDAALRSVPGIGPWTSAETRQRVLGDADAVSVGDVHLPGVVGWALAGERNADDERMLQLLAPWPGHRYRAVKLIEMSGVSPGRHAPRYTPLDHRAR